MDEQWRSNLQDVGRPPAQLLTPGRHSLGGASAAGDRPKHWLEGARGQLETN